jgi:hypothetical protein
VRLLDAQLRCASQVAHQRAQQHQPAWRDQRRHIDAIGRPVLVAGGGLHDAVPVEQRLIGVQAPGEHAPNYIGRRAWPKALDRAQRGVVVAQRRVVAECAAGLVAGSRRIAQHRAVGALACLPKVQR